MDSNKSSYIRLNGHILALIFLISLFANLTAFGQGCPQFEIAKIENTSQERQFGSIEITIKSAKTYNVDNFDIRQKANQVTGPLGYNVEMTVSGNRLVIDGLRKSEEMYLGEYVVRFSDKACNNGALLEAGVFKIK